MVLSELLATVDKIFTFNNDEQQKIIVTHICRSQNICFQGREPLCWSRLQSPCAGLATTAIGSDLTTDSMSYVCFSATALIRACTRT